MKTFPSISSFSKISLSKDFFEDLIPLEATDHNVFLPAKKLVEKHFS